MKALQKEMEWVEKQFFLVECKKLNVEKKKVEDLRNKLKNEMVVLNKLDCKIHCTLTKRALGKLKKELKSDGCKLENQYCSLIEHEKHLKRHFALEKYWIIRKEKEKEALTKRGGKVI